jgi:DNA-binding NtrC family response regulator
VEIRVLAASNADFEQRIAAGRFRQDLYFRLARFVVEVPPLRDRREDIPLLVDHFLKIFAADMNLAKPSLTSPALAAMMAYDYPGNVRELKNIVERSLIESGGAPIQAEHLHFLSHPWNWAREGGLPAGTTSPVPREGAPAQVLAPSDEQRIIAYVQQHGSINNTECRQLLSVGMHRASYLLSKLHQRGQLQQESGRRWAQYRLP